MGLSLLPLFLAKLTVGPLSGFLLGRYCPAEGARDSAKLWLVVASMAIATPVLIVLLKGVIRPRSREEEGTTAEDADEGATETEPDSSEADADPNGESTEEAPA
jgi:hypothetical protein